MEPWNIVAQQRWLEDSYRRNDFLLGCPETAARLMLRLQAALAGHVAVTHVRPPDVEPTASGSYSHGLRRIFVEAKSDVCRMFHTLLHETAHFLLHSLVPAFPVCGYDAQEVVAESAAYLVARRVGIDTLRHSTAYLSPYVVNDGYNPRSYNEVIALVAYHLERMLLG
jgi:hypothetical protein